MVDPLSSFHKNLIILKCMQNFRSFTFEKYTASCPTSKSAEILQKFCIGRELRRFKKSASNVPTFPKTDEIFDVD
jgi:hypothetical protein